MGLLTTFGNPFCGYDSLNIQTVLDTSEFLFTEAVVSEDTDILYIEPHGGCCFVTLPLGAAPKGLSVFARSDNLYTILFDTDGEGYSESIDVSTNRVFHIVRFNGHWFLEQ